MADKHGADRLDAACRRAIEVGDPSYKTVKGILAAGAERDVDAPAPEATAPAHMHGQQALFGPNDGEAAR